MAIRMKSYLAAIAVLGISLPLWAHTDSVPFQVDHTLTIGTQQLEPGNYNLKSKDGENQLQIVRNSDGKTIATVPCTWIDLSRKADQSEVVTNENRVVEVEFDGKNKAIEFR